MATISTHFKMRHFTYLQLPDDEAFDLFLDGSIVCIDTKGHTEGHQSVIVDLPFREGGVGRDAAQVEENLSDSVPPGMSWSSQRAVQSITKLRHMQNQGALVILGHELSALESLKLAPDYYD